MASADLRTEAILSATARATGENYFATLVKALSETFSSRYAFVSEFHLDASGEEIQTRAFWADGAPAENFKAPLEGSPCSKVLGGAVCFYGADVQASFPNDADLVALNVQSYLGVPISAWDGRVLGHIVVMDDRVMDEDPGREAVLQLFAEQAAGELQRVENERALRESEARLRFFFEAVPDAIRVINREGVITYANAPYGSDGGSRLVGKHFNELFGGTERDRLSKLFEATLRTADTSRFQLKSGVSDRIYEARLVPVLNGDTVTDVIFIGTDISDRMQQREELEVAQASYQFLAERMNDFIWVIDPDLVYTYVSPSVTRTLGYTPTELIGKSVFDNLDTGPDTWGRITELIEAANRGEISEALFELQVNTKDGGKVRYETTAVVLLDENQSIIGFQGISRDVSERRQAEEALRASEELHRFLNENMTDVLWRMDANFNITYVTPSIERATGYSADEVLGKSSVFNTPQEDLQHVFDCIAPLIAGTADQAVYEQRVTRKDGEIVHHEVDVVALRDEDGNLTGLQGVSRDISERVRAREALREREEQYRLMLETSHEGICLVDSSVTIRFANRRSAEILGYEVSDLIGADARDFIFKSDFVDGGSLIKSLQAGAPAFFEFRFHHRDGHEVWTEVSASAFRDEDGEIQGILGMFTDVTDRKRAEQERRELEAQVQHAQKLESLGVLAGGIAHDFNNLLAGIMGYASLLEQDMDHTDPRIDYVRKIETASLRAAELTKQMLAYSGRGKFVMHDIDLTKSVREMVDLVNASVSKNAKLEFDFADDPLIIHADAAQVTQVVMNLIINAADALAEAPGVIAVRTASLHADEALLARNVVRDPLPAGPYVVLEVSDTGPGMDADTVQRIFDPFFTTKFTGRGLGLAAVLGIIRGHKGAIFVESAPGEGARIRVLFPAASQPEVPTDDSAALGESNGHGTGTVLVVDDDATVRRLAEDILVREGYDVVAVNSGEKALAAFREEAATIDVVLLDLTMPGLAGTEVFESLRAIDSGLPVVISSGYTEEDVLDRFDDRRRLYFIQKPYRRDELVALLSRALESAPSES